MIHFVIIVRMQNFSKAHVVSCLLYHLPRTHASRTQERLKDTKIDVCFTSDLQRASRTAEIILEDYHADTPLIVDPRIKEKVGGLLTAFVPLLLP